MCAMGFPAAAAAVDLLRTNARTRRILASAVRVTALMLHGEAFPQAFLQRRVPLGGSASLLYQPRHKLHGEITSRGTSIHPSERTRRSPPYVIEQPAGVVGAEAKFALACPLRTYICTHSTILRRRGASRT